MSLLSNYITVNSKVQFGEPVFKGTRVPVKSLFWHLEKRISLDAFLEDFPSVSREQTKAVLAWSAKHFESPESIIDETIVG